MSDRVHPSGSPAAEDDPTKAQSDATAKTETDPSKPKPPPPPPTPGMYVIQVPKDQIYRVPPPENAKLYQSYSRHASGRRRSSRCCRCLLFSLAALLFLLFALAAAVGVLYLVFRPKFPTYSIDRLSIRGLNLTSGLALSPELDATIGAVNPNGKIGIYYRGGSSISVSYSDAALCDGAWPTFYQGKGNATVFKTALRGSGVRLSSGLQAAMVKDEGRRMVPLAIKIEVPVRLKVGAVTSWAFKVKVRCGVTVDSLTAESRIVSKNGCDTKVDVF